MRSLSELWKKEKCPILDGVIFSDGTIVEFNIYRALNKLQFEEIARTQIFEVLKKDPDNITNLYHSTIQLFHNSYKYMAGECSWGGDGYVACLDVNTNDILWIFTSDKINPIVSLEVLNNKIIAQNNCGSAFSIDIDNAIKRVIIKQIF